VKRPMLISLILALAIQGAVGVAAATRSAGSARGIARNGDWIAYSTAPAGSDGPAGSDIFIARAGGQPKLVADRINAYRRYTMWNVCPAFSPSGKLLAYARMAPRPEGSAVVVVAIAPDGTVSAPRATLRVPGPSAQCPKWSSDSSRLAYLEEGGTIVVRGLDGSTPHWAPGDPTIHDFYRNRLFSPKLDGIAIFSPGGDLVAVLTNGGIRVSRPDGSDKRIIPDDPPSYAIAGWSPDGRKLLLMRDVGPRPPGSSLPPCASQNDFTMRAVTTQAPFASTPIASYVCTDGDRAWPGYGDVSWQPIPQR
jgi:Tol biopolymer transport system component